LGTKKFPNKIYFTSIKTDAAVQKKASVVFDSKEFIYFFEENYGHGHN